MGPGHPRRSLAGAPSQVLPTIVSEKGFRIAILGIQHIPGAGSLRWATIAFKGDCVPLGVMIDSGKNDSIFVGSVEERIFYHLLAYLSGHLPALYGHSEASNSSLNFMRVT